MKKIKRLSLFISIVVLVFASCRKQSDTFGPQITITKPFENQQFNIYDDITITANICDDRKLASIDISITNEEFITVMTASTIFPENNCYDVNLAMPITDIHLPTGIYYLLIRASDGLQETKKFLKIYITTLPKKLKYLIVVSKNAGQIKIGKIDSTNTLTPLKTLTTDYCGSAVSSDAQQFYIAGRSTGDVQVFSTVDWQLQWIIPCAASPSIPYFEAIDVHKKMLYVSYHSGKFEVYNANGSIRALRNVDNGQYATRFTPVGNYLITYQRNPSAMSKNLVIYNTPSYAIWQKFILNYEVQNIQNLNNQQGLLFCNHVNYVTFKIVDIASQTLTDIGTTYDYPIKSVAHIYQNEYAYIAGNALFNYNYPDISSLPLNYGININHLIYDEVNNNYYLSEDYHTVKKFVFPHNNPEATVAVPDTIINILPVYNKD